jgi:hypothetical protein
MEFLRTTGRVKLHEVASAKSGQEQWLPGELEQIHESRKNSLHPLENFPLVMLAGRKGEGNAHQTA